MQESEQAGASSFGGGRQRRVPGGRDKQFLVRVTEKQHAMLLAKAAVYGVSVQKLMVESALSSVAEVAADNAATRAEVIANLFNTQRFLASIANNVNQIARATNASGELPLEMRDDLRMSLRRSRDAVRHLEGFIRDFQGVER